MRILDRYILRAHIAPFLFGTVTVVFIFLMQFFLKAIDELVGKGLDAWVIVQLIGLNMAWMLVLAVPIGVLFSTLMAFGSMSSVHEVTVIKASGGSLLRMMAPVMIIGAILTLLLFWFNDRVLPESNHRAKILMSDIKKKKPTFSLESGQFSTDLEGYTILPREVDSVTGAMKGVTIYDHRRINETNILNADSGIVKFSPDLTKLIITLFNGEIHQLHPGELRDYRKVDFDKHQVSLSARGFSFVRSEENVMSRGDREMRIEQMEEIRQNAIKKINESEERIREQLEKHVDYIEGDMDAAAVEGLRYKGIEKDSSLRSSLLRSEKRINFIRQTIQSDIFQKEEYERKKRQYGVEIQKKYAIPFACLIFVLVGCPLGIITRGGNFGISAAITLAFYILYWICLIGGEKLADRGFLSPVLSMWLGNIIIGVIGLALTFKVSYETLGIVPFFKKIFRLGR